MIENARLRKAALFCLFLLAGRVLSACMKFELQYDFLQYHYYNGFAFWNNRLGVDIAPAFIPTFYNPLLDAVMYALMSVLKQHVTIYCFIQGLWFGALSFVAYRKHINKKVLFAGIYALVSFIVWEILSFNARFLAPVEIVAGILMSYAAFCFWKKHSEVNVKTAAFYALATNVMRGKKKYILMDKLLWLGNDDVTFGTYSWNCRHIKVGDIGLFDDKRFYFLCDKDNEQ